MNDLIKTPLTFSWGLLSYFLFKNEEISAYSSYINDIKEGNK